MEVKKGPISDAARFHVTDDVAVGGAVYRPFQRDQNAQLPRCVFVQAQKTELFVGRRRR